MPPTERTETGYRVFTEAHRAALLTYRALLRGFGPEAAREVMRAVHLGKVSRALARIDAEHAALHTQRTELREIGAALETMADVEPDAPALPRQALRIGAVARQLGVRKSALRVWERAGLLTPRREPGTGYRSFTPTDVRDARMIAMLRRGRYPLPQVRRVLDGLRHTGSRNALRAAIADRAAELDRRARAMLEAAGRLHTYLDALGGGSGADEPARSHAARTARRASAAEIVSRVCSLNSPRHVASLGGRLNRCRAGAVPEGP